MSGFAGSFDVFPGWTGQVAMPFEMWAGIFTCVTQTADGYESNANFAGYTGDTAMSVGFATTNLDQACIISVSDQQAFAPFNRSSRGTFGDRLVVAQRHPDAAIPSDWLRLADVGRCKLVFDTFGTGSYRVHFVAWSGSTLNRKVGVVTIPGDGSDATVTGLPFDPSGKPGIVFGAWGANSADADHGITGLGFSTLAAARSKLWVINYNDRGGAADSLDALAHFGLYGVDLASLDADGFTLSQTSAFGTDVDMPYLLLSDENGAFTVADTPWSAGTVTVGHSSDAVVFCDNISNEEDTGGQLTVGFAARDRSATKTEAMLAGVANVDDQRRWTAMATNSGEVLLDYLGNPGTQSGSLTVDAMSATGFTLGGSASGSQGSVAYASVKTSSAGPGRRCRRGGLPSWPRGSVG